MRIPRSQVLVPHALTHVIVRGNNGRRLFSSHKDRVEFLRYLLGASAATKCAIHALVLMTNHVHLAVTPPSVEAMSTFVKYFAQRHAMRRNRARGMSGKLFDTRYGSFVVQDDAIGVVLAYIELNPVRARMVEHPAEYPWSTYRLHAGLPGTPSAIAKLWTPCDWYLRLGPERHGLYRDLVDDQLERWRAEQQLAAAAVEQFGTESVSSKDRGPRRIRRPDRTSAA